MSGRQAEKQDEERVYRAYWIGPSGRFTSAKIIQARNDAQAIRFCKDLAQNCAVELWERARFLRRIEPKITTA